MGNELDQRSSAYRDVISAVWGVIDEVGIPKHLQELAFREGLKFLSSVQPDRDHFVERVSQTTKDVTALPVQESGAEYELDESLLIERISSETGVGRDKIEELVYTDQGKIHINRPGLKLGRNNTERTKVVAAFLTIVRNFGLDEDETPVETIRDEVQRLRVYDANNFAAQLKSMPGFVLKGSGQSRRLQAKATGVAEFADLVESMLAEG